MWLDLLAATLVLIAGVVGVAASMITLSGSWLIIGVAAICTLWRTGLISPWLILVCVALAALAEVIEFVGSAYGSKRAGGSRAGAWGALLGSLVGLVVGQIVIPVPILGALIGAIVGAGVGAVVLERGGARRPWRESIRSGQGAAVGRLGSVFVKAGIAAVIAVLLTVAAYWP